VGAKVDSEGYVTRPDNSKASRGYDMGRGSVSLKEIGGRKTAESEPVATRLQVESGVRKSGKLDIKDAGGIANVRLQLGKTV